jgi:probable HAF family extracellular repeat protein
MITFKRCNLVAIGLVGLLSSAFAEATAFKYTDLGTLGGMHSGAMAINDAGAIAGFAFTQASTTHAAVWQNGAIEDLGSGQQTSVALSINRQGQVAGYASSSSGDIHATIWSDAQKIDLSTPGEAYSLAYGINDLGQVAGYSYTNGLTNRAIFWNGVSLTTLSDSNVLASHAYAINNSGRLAGDWYGSGSYDSFATTWNGDNRESDFIGVAYAINDKGDLAGFSYLNNRAVYWDGYTTIYLGTLGGSYSMAYGLNEKGQVVGMSETSGDMASHAVLWNGDSEVDLNTSLDADETAAGWVLTEARGINESGYIVGNARNSITGEQHAFLLTPVPEPDTSVLLAGGLLALLAVKRKRK